MTDLALILVATVLVNNFVLVRFLGLCPFMGVSRRTEQAVGMALATAFVLTLASVASHIVFVYLLVPFGLEWLRTLAFIFLIAALVQFTEMAVHKASPLLYRTLGIYLPLITTNCAVLGVALLNAGRGHNLLEAGFYGLGAALGFGLVLVMFTGLRERIERSPVPRAFQGASIGLITAGIMALAFMGFAGMTPA